MQMFQSVIRGVATILSGRNLEIYSEISEATGVSVLRLVCMTRTQILDTIRDAGIPLSTIPQHIVNALGLVRAD